MTALGEMASGIAHEINTPLASIMMKTAVLKLTNQTGSSNDEKIDRVATEIDGIVFRIAEIIKGMRPFVRDGQRDSLEDNTVASIVQDTLAFCKERF